MKRKHSTNNHDDDNDNGDQNNGRDDAGDENHVIKLKSITKKKYFAVAVGRVPGVYETWEECKAQIDQFPQARYMSFASVEPALKFALPACARKKATTSAEDRSFGARPHEGKNRIVRPRLPSTTVAEFMDRFRYNTATGGELTDEKAEYVPTDAELAVSSCEDKIASTATTAGRTVVAHQAKSSLLSYSRAEFENAENNSSDEAAGEHAGSSEDSNTESDVEKTGTQQSIVAFSLFSGNKFAVSCCGTAETDPQLREILESAGGHMQSLVPSSQSECVWICPLGQYSHIVETIEARFSRRNTSISVIPQYILDELQHSECTESVEDASSFIRNSTIPPTLWPKLLPFQREGVQFIVQRNGRGIIADEMGLGKTVQALTAAAHYRAEWPLLCIVPSAVRLNWAAEFQKWLPFSTTTRIAVVGKGNQQLPHVDAIIISYDLVSKYINELQARKIQVIICDEAHFLKNHNAQRTVAIVPLLSSAKRVFLLTGTPALSRPMELFTLLHVVAPKSFPRYHTFGARYCDPKRGYRGHWMYKGATNLPELHVRLKRVMVRRLKQDVLKYLPPKKRTVLRIETGVAQLPSISIEEIDKVIQAAQQRARAILPEKKEYAEYDEDDDDDDDDDVDVSAAAPATDGNEHEREANECKNRADGEAMVSGIDNVTDLASLRPQQRPVVMELYQNAGLSKLNAIKEYIEQLVEGSSKFLVFAHHRVVMDHIEQHLTALRAGFVRIDGQTNSKQRHELVTKFQTKPATRCALLSITAAGQGITLNAAHIVVFAELYWNPGHLLQAEDRAHRIGQQHQVDAVYILGANTLDDVMWPLLDKKLTITGSALDGAADKLGADALVSDDLGSAEQIVKVGKAGSEQK